MTRVARLIFNRWVLTAIGLLAFALLIWWVGPTLSISNFYPLEAEWARWLNIALVILSPAGRWAWRTIQARRANATLTGGLLQPAATPDASAEEVGHLRQRFEEALGLLRKLRFGTAKPSLAARIRSLASPPYLYDLPWYVFIGAPGAGKTTALLNSGLRFPLAERSGREPVQGVGGTRNCDWWFTDDAVFLDTAGRYTTQQSDRDVDAAAWKGFLQLLKKTRPRRPINGVLLTVSVGDLLQQAPAEAQAHARAIRARIEELYTELKVRVPIYVIVSKSDLLAGFTEFFATLGKDERAQVWGFSLPSGKELIDPPALSAELARLERRLFERLPERLEDERDPARRALLYAFPQQFAVLRGRVVDFMEATFAPTKFAVTPILRGIYFTSGTQESSPVDRVMGALARDLGLERKLLPAQYPSGKSYFLTRLLRDVIFPEAGLTGIDSRWERQRRWLERGAMGAAVAAIVLAVAAWSVSYAHNRRYIADVAGHLEQTKQYVAEVRSGAKSDLSALLPTLTSVSTLSRAEASSDGSVPWSWRFGLYQGGKLETASRAAYHQMLQDTFLPSLASYLERYLRLESSGSQDEAYDALKTYLMLYDRLHFNQAAVWRWYQKRGEQLFASAEPNADSAFKKHFDALYDGRWVQPTIARNDEVVSRVRAAIGRDSLASRIYGRLKREPLADLRDFTVVEKAGPKAMLVFERVSREPLTKGVPGLYTKDGYYRHFAKRIELATAELAEEESWVLGTRSGTPGALVAATKLPEAVKRLYLEDYRRTWRAFISDVTVIRDRDIAKSIEITQVLSAADSPIKLLTKAMVRETTLSVPPEADVTRGGAVATKAQEVAAKARQVIQGGSAGALEKELVDDQFEDLRQLAGTSSGSGPAPIDGVVQLFKDLNQILVATKAALDAGQTPPQTDVVTKLRAEASRQPEPVRSMMQGLIEEGMQRELRRVREMMSGELRSQVTDFCVKAIEGRYPFAPASKQDVTPEDFARLFAPGGLLESYFQKQMAQYVDTSQKPWQFKAPGMGQSATLAEFQRAQIIRDVFFRGGGNTPSIQLDFKPVEMDASIQQFLLDVDGKPVRYAHGPQVPVRVQFPGPSGRSQVRMSISPPPPSGASGVTYDGPWALFRMFDGVQITETRQPERFVATVNVEGRRAVFEISTSSVRNPFRLPELRQFRCPTGL